MDTLKESLNYIACRKECEICMEHRYLKQFCEKHSFCHSCCKQWCDQNIFCPICRDKCINKEYLDYDYHLKNCDYQHFKNKNYEFYFQIWHKESCIKKKHKFFITLYENHILFYCKDCHIEQLFFS